LNNIKVQIPVGRPRTRPGAVAGDKAYSSRKNRSYLRRRGITAVIAEPKDQAQKRKDKGHRGGRPVTCDPSLYTQRNTVERAINRIKAWRGLATRDDKRPESYQAELELRAALLWIHSLEPTQ
jgi:transposase